MFVEVSEKLSNLFDYICSINLCCLCRVKSTDFTRNRSLNFVNLVLLILSSGGKSNTLELIDFFDKMGEVEVSKEAFSQARLKLKPLVFKKLNEFYLTMVYENKSRIKTINNHILLACDGSKLELPHHKLLIKIFGGTKNKFNEIKSCMGNSSMIYDVLNKFIFDFEVDTYKTSEKVLAYRNLKNLLKFNFLKDYKKIFIFDRGYRSIEFFNHFMQNKGKFVFRLRSTDYKKRKIKIKKH